LSFFGFPMQIVPSPLFHIHVTAPWCAWWSPPDQAAYYYTRGLEPPNWRPFFLHWPLLLARFGAHFSIGNLRSRCAVVIRNTQHVEVSSPCKWDIRI
jgi:hypothetical protein